MSDLTEKFLKGSLTADIFAIRRGDRVPPIGPELPRLVPERPSRSRSSSARASSGTSTPTARRTPTKHGSRFPRKMPAESSPRAGTLGADGRLDLAADRLSQLVLDHAGQPMDRRQPPDIHTALYNNGIGPGADRLVRYALRVPKDARGTVRLSASVDYRKFSRDYSIFVGGPDAPTLPVVVISNDSVALPVGDATARPEVSRANDVAPAGRAQPDAPAGRGTDAPLAALERLRTGLFLQGDLRGAEAAWAKTGELAPDKPDGP